MLKINDIKKEKILIGIYIFVIIIGISSTYFRESVQTFSMPVSKKNIVIDAGHGGYDPGKVRNDGIQEKNINLEIALKLQKYLEQSGAYVITTRADDTALSQNKRKDLKERKDIANEKDVDLLVSIHQNSFPKQSAKGAQVFYYSKSEESKIIATNIQNRLKEIADPENTRISKPNKEYYLLKQTSVPAVIVECGFLSNDDENKKLNSDEYQNKIAWAIYMGIVDYYNGTENKV